MSLYLKLQLLYLLASGGFVLPVALIGLRVLPRRSFLRHAVLVGWAGFVAAVGLVLGVVPSFGAVAFTFYGAFLWAPVTSLLAGLARGKPWRSSAPTIALALASLLVAVYAAFVEPNRLQVREHRLAFEAWPADAEPIRIVHVSDLQTVGECEREREAARRINALEPDFVVFTGDYAAGPFGAEPCPAIAAARKFLSELEPRIATIVVMGHSETEWERSQIFDGLDLTYLVNETETFELPDGRELWFLGLHSWHGRENYRPLTSPREPGALRVVVSHVPDVTTRMEDRDLDLHLAGHTHGGQIVVPFFGPPITLSRLPRRYARGLHRFGDHWLNVCAGLGMEGNHAPRIRFLCPPEIVLLELVGEE